MIRDDGSSAADSSQTSDQSSGYLTENDADTVGEPFALVYGQGIENANSFELYWRPFAGGDATLAHKFNEGSYLNHAKVHGKYIAVALEGTNGPEVWLSGDGGKSFTSIFTGTKPSDEYALGDQITSILFSNDGKKLLIAILDTKTAESSNVTKEYDIASKSTKEIFTTDDNGVFLMSYDSSSHKLIYNTGCYNCDGNTGVPVHVRDVSTNIDKVIIESTNDRYLEKYAFNDDGSEMLYVLSTQSNEGLGGGDPYTIMRYNFASNESTAVKEIATAAGRIMVGYTKEGRAVYANGHKLLDLKDDTVVFESSKLIHDIYYLSKQTLVLATGEYGNYDVVSFDTAANKVTTLFTADSLTTTIGISEL